MVDIRVVANTRGSNRHAAIRGQVTKSTIGIGAHGAVVDIVAVLVDRVVNTREVVAVTASTSNTASLVERLMLATVARITVAIEVASSVVALVSAETSRSRVNVAVALDGSGSLEVTRVGRGQGSAVKGGNVSAAILGIGDLRTVELVEIVSEVILEGVNDEVIVVHVSRGLIEARAIDDLVEVVALGDAVDRGAPELPPISTIEVSDITEGKLAVLAERTVVLATVSEETVAVNPARRALELALTSPVVTSLTVARRDVGEVESSEIEITAVEGTLTLVVHGSLATVRPVAVKILTKSSIADGEVALRGGGAISVSGGNALRPVPGVKTINRVALNALALRTAGTVVEDVSLATSHGVSVAVLPASLNVADKVAKTSVLEGSVRDASDPGVNSGGGEVRARENVAVASQEVISGERPELEERAPNTTDVGVD